MKKYFYYLIFFLIALTACSPQVEEVISPVNRLSLIPENQVKISEAGEVYPVVSLTNEYKDPVPLPYPVNTAGAEDSAFILPDGETLYVWFTPDVNNPVQNQATDGVTGIYVYQKGTNGWEGPERVYLNDPGKATLDGCEFVLGDTMWFCSAREGYTDIHWFTARQVDDSWTDWELADFEPAYEVGELHITADGQELYFHSSRPGGYGGYDIWVSKHVGGEWDEPENVKAVNSEYTDGWPFISHDGNELWFTRAIGAPELWRSLKIDGQWTEPTQMFSIFSGESSLDIFGNVYFTHHYFKDDQMLEADIYIAQRKK
jgi:hypothetical protein